MWGLYDKVTIIILFLFGRCWRVTQPIVIVIFFFSYINKWRFLPKNLTLTLLMNDNTLSWQSLSSKWDPDFFKTLIKRHGSYFRWKKWKFFVSHDALLWRYINRECFLSMNWTSWKKQMSSAAGSASQNEDEDRRFYKSSWIVSSSRMYYEL